MQPATITLLNQLNQQFYQTVGVAFDATRQLPWPGWDKCRPFFPADRPLTVWDIGCGNGRFGAFLTSHDIENTYIGFDTNEALLESARRQLPHAELRHFDIIETATSGNWSTLPTAAPHLITLFGVIHHIPSQQLKEAVLHQLADRLAPGGVLILAAWQFLNDARLKERLVEPTTVDIQPASLEKNDFILDWQRGTPAYRYCHLVDETELAELVTASGLQLTQQFFADGKEGNLNLYAVLSR